MTEVHIIFNKVHDSIEIVFSTNKAAEAWRSSQGRPYDFFIFSSLVED